MFVWYIVLMKDEKNYHIELHADGFKEGNGFKGFDSACAHFGTDESIDAPHFHVIMNKAIDKIAGQQLSHGWADYTVGKLFVQDGEEPVSVMSPAWEYRTPASMTTPVWKEVKETA